MNIIPAKAVEQHIAVLGKTGSGKTYAAKSIVESLLRSGQQVVMIDPTSAWWGLRLSASGKSAGFERVLILGGPKGDMPLPRRRDLWSPSSVPLRARAPCSTPRT